VPGSTRPQKLARKVAHGPRGRRLPILGQQRSKTPAAAIWLLVPGQGEAPHPVIASAAACLARQRTDHRQRQPLASPAIPAGANAARSQRLRVFRSDGISSLAPLGRGGEIEKLSHSQSRSRSATNWRNKPIDGASVRPASVTNAKRAPMANGGSVASSASCPASMPARAAATMPW